MFKVSPTEPVPPAPVVIIETDFPKFSATGVGASKRNRYAKTADKPSGIVGLQIAHDRAIKDIVSQIIECARGNDDEMFAALGVDNVDAYSQSV